MACLNFLTFLGACIRFRVRLGLLLIGAVGSSVAGDGISSCGCISALLLLLLVLLVLLVPVLELVLVLSVLLLV